MQAYISPNTIRSASLLARNHGKPQFDFRRFSIGELFIGQLPLKTLQVL